MGNSKVYNLVECEANLSHGLSNLLSLAAQASQVERENGLQWYAQAYFECVELGKLYNLSLERIIACVACLSPQLRWSHNILVAEIVIRYYVAGGYIPAYNDYLSKRASLVELGNDPRLPKIPANVTGANKVKALWILQGYDALSGQKVTSFYDNLLRFGDSSRVTVDSHAISAWFGVIDAQSVSITPSYYQIVEADYRKCAKILGISPLECQAIIWVVKRRLSGSDKRDNEGVSKLLAALGRIYQSVADRAGIAQAVELE